MPIRACADYVDWTTCDLSMCCQRHCKSINCGYVSTPNDTIPHYSLTENHECFGMVSDPVSVNETYLRACDFKSCCEHELQVEPIGPTWHDIGLESEPEPEPVLDQSEAPTELVPNLLFE